MIQRQAWRVLGALLFSTGLGHAASGTIEFVDRAPPPSKADSALAKTWSQRVQTLASEIERLGTVMRATARLQKVAEMMKYPSSDQAAQLTSGIDTLQAASARLFAATGAPVTTAAPKEFFENPPEPMIMWTFNGDAIPDYVQKALALAGVAAAASEATSNFDRAGFQDAVTRLLKAQAEWFDVLVAEHSLLNMRLRYYPYNGEKQTPIACTLINANSATFRCLPANASGVVDDPAWIFGRANLAEYCSTTNLQPFGVDDAPKFLIFVHKTSPWRNSARQLVDARVAKPLARAFRTPGCV